ncbi:protein kinase (plasmid) [Halarchaeum sp. CBA1220]|uniref:elongation factor 1-alpha C-terminal domain-related protein n=1 Tax=Halarchaeum sp. CBA1220 TaxID=1853682 RepID=UPI000F3A9429|nr:protein kinase [Halarchaeum sp. CBA1220]QLC35565.1 protein kinase [Halarchaeum sp. CBA1220]
MDYGEWERIPDPESISSPERRNVNYADIDVDERIGTGGHADVSVATADGTRLVLKEPRLQGTVSQETYEAFLDEAETWARLDDHANVVGVVDWGADQLPWIAMEYMDGGSLRERIDAESLSTMEALWIGVRLSRAVQHAHRHGVVHLDLKPANVLFRATSDGVWDAPKIGDWGLSSYLLEHSGTVEGLSPNYAAPEQFDADEYGPPDDFTDRYQLAALCYEALTGEQVAPGTGAAVLRQVLDGSVTAPSEVDSSLPAALDPIFEKALATQKEERYETVVNFRRDLEGVLEEHVAPDAVEAKSANGESESGETADRREAGPSMPPLSHSAYVSNDETADTLLSRVPETIGSQDDGTVPYGEHVRDLAGNVPVPRDDVMPLRVPIHLVYTHNEDTICRGTVVAGELHNDMGVWFRPSNVSATVVGIERQGDDADSGLVRDDGITATPGDVVEFAVESDTGSVDRETLAAGEICTIHGNPPTVAGTIHARIAVLDDASVVTPGYTPVVHAHLTQAACTVEELGRVFDPSSGEIVEENPDFVEPGQAADVVLEAQQPLVLDSVVDVPELGVFGVRDAGETVAVGVVTDVEATGGPEASDEESTGNEETVDPLSRLPDLQGVSVEDESVRALFERVAANADVFSPVDAPLRLPIEDVHSLSDVGTVLTGRIESGVVESGEEVAVQPSNVSGEVTRIEREHEARDRAEASETISFQIDGVQKNDVRRGDVCGTVDRPPQVAATFRIQLYVPDHPSVITAGYTPVVHAHTAQVACTIESIHEQLDPESGDVVEENPDFIDAGDVAVVTLDPMKPLSVEPFTTTPELGSVVLRDAGETVGVGAVLDVEETQSG